MYTSTMSNLNREWAAPDVREQTLNEIQDVGDVVRFYKLLDQVEGAFADPYQVTYKQDTGDGAQDDEQDIP